MSREEGLTDAEAEERRQQYGPNRLRESEQKSWRRILYEQFTSLVVILLLIASVTAMAFGQIVEGIAIAAALVINAAIGFVTEYKALQSMEALRRIGQVDALVRRGGETREVPADALVPGDIVLLTEGEVVPADLRLLSTENLQANESALTGESVPVDKTTEPLEGDEAPLAERSNMVFSGTSVSRGAAECVVVATGMDTEIGRISRLVEGAEDTATPLERRLERLGQKLIYVVIAVGIVVAGAGIAAGKDLYLMIETAIILAIAAVPEGLPIVSTVALGRGMWRMARRNALVKRLSAVETLGATTVIFTDKTGTLTENSMVMRRVALPAGDIEVVRDGDGATLRDGSEPVSLEDRPDLAAALRVGVLCGNVERAEDDDGGEADRRWSGDPTEVALVAGGIAAGLDHDRLRETLPEEREESFDSATKMMATFHAGDDGYLVLVKGAPEAVLDACVRVGGADGEPSEMDDAIRDEWVRRNQDMAGDGLRVLAVAEKTTGDVSDDPYAGLTLLGLVGLYDPPRETISAAIAACRHAGIGVVMVTGDQPATAANIAHAIGIADDERPEVLRGRDLGRIDQADDDARAAILRTSIFARVSPEQKLSLITVYQDAGAIVGMTGDGVNDAPALKKADIGIAMGQRGTEVARETSDIVLKDDAFETIVMAIEQGRSIFDNIRKFIVFLLSGNLGQIIAITVAALLNAPLPLLPLQILFLNLLLDVFPALAIGVGKGDSSVMNRPPRDPREPIIARRHWLAVTGFGAVIAASVLGAFAYALVVMGLDEREAVTISFLTYAFARLWHAFNMRSVDSNIVANDITRNPFVWGALAVCGGLLLVAVYVPFMASLLNVTVPGPQGWAVIAVGSLAPLVVGQAALFVTGLARRRASTPEDQPKVGVSRRRDGDGEQYPKPGRGLLLVPPDDLLDSSAEQHHQEGEAKVADRAREGGGQQEWQDGVGREPAAHGRHLKRDGGDSDAEDDPESVPVELTLERLELLGGVEEFQRPPSNRLEGEIADGVADEGPEKAAERGHRRDQPDPLAIGQQHGHHDRLERNRHDGAFGEGGQEDSPKPAPRSGQGDCCLGQACHRGSPSSAGTESPVPALVAVRLVRVAAREMPVHFALDVADNREGGERQNQRDHGDRIITAAAGQPERADEPDAGAGGDAQDRAPGLNDGPRAEECHSRDHRFDHASGIRPDGGGVRSDRLHHLDRDQGERGGRQRHQHMGPQARGLAPDLPVQTDDHAEQQRQTEPCTDVDESCLRFSVKYEQIVEHFVSSATRGRCFRPRLAPFREMSTPLASGRAPIRRSATARTAPGRSRR